MIIRVIGVDEDDGIRGYFDLAPFDFVSKSMLNSIIIKNYEMSGHHRYLRILIANRVPQAAKPSILIIIITFLSQFPTSRILYPLLTYKILSSEYQILVSIFPLNNDDENNASPLSFPLLPSPHPQKIILSSSAHFPLSSLHLLSIINPPLVPLLTSTLNTIPLPPINGT